MAASSPFSPCGPWGADRALQSSLSARRLAGVGRAEIPIAVVTNVRGDAVRAGSTVSSFWRRDIIRRAVRQQHGVHVAAKFVLALVGDGFYASAVLASAPAARLRRLVDCGYEAGFIFGGEVGEVADLGLQLRPNRQRRLCAGVRVWIRTTLDDAELCIYGWSRSTAVGRATIHAYAQGTAVLCQHLMRYDAAVADIVSAMRRPLPSKTAYFISKRQSSVKTKLMTLPTVPLVSGSRSITSARLPLMWTFITISPPTFSRARGMP